MQRFATALVLGYGASGEAAARLLRHEGASVTVMDQHSTPDLKDRVERAGCHFEAGAPPPDRPFDLCVISPGIPADHEWVQRARARCGAVLPEFELGWSRFGGRTIAVTGTNGKSTIVKWIAECVNRSGARAIPCGNYGRPVCDAALDNGADWLVIEASSFQLEIARDFRANAALLLNLAPNHLDRHRTMESYTAAKARLFARATDHDACVVPSGLAASFRARARGGRWITFGAAGADFVFEAGVVRSGGAVAADLRSTYFDNDVLGSNAAGAVAAMRAAGLTREGIETAARAFAPLAHRMEPVGERDGVRFVNDSKATTLAALEAGIRMCRGRVRLVAGGQLKEFDLERVKKVLAERVSAIYLIGQASDEMRNAWSGAVKCVACGELEKAVQRAALDAAPGETVLLSPGCASFDQFRSYAERGDRFRALVAGLIRGEQL